MADQVVLTKKQKLVYDYLVYYKTLFDGNSPSLRVIAGAIAMRGMPITDTTVMECIRAMPELVRRGDKNDLELVYGKWTVEDEPEITVK